jgi:hypothetical protein
MKKMIAAALLSVVAFTFVAGTMSFAVPAAAHASPDRGGDGEEDGGRDR